MNIIKAQFIVKQIQRKIAIFDSVLYKKLIFKPIYHGVPFFFIYDPRPLL